MEGRGDYNGVRLFSAYIIFTGILTRATLLPGPVVYVTNNSNVTFICSAANSWNVIYFYDNGIQESNLASVIFQANSTHCRVLYINTLFGEDKYSALPCYVGQPISITVRYINASYNNKYISCKVDSGELSKTTVKIRVPITSVTLTNAEADENTVNIINGQNTMFTCRTNAGRPSSNIQWYIASVNITSSASSQPDVCATDCSDDKIVSSSQLIYKGKKEDSGKIIYCTASNIQGYGVRSSNKTIHVFYLPNIHMDPIYNPYIVYHSQRDVVLICVIDDANPSTAVTYEWNSLNGTVNTQNITIPTVTKLHNGQYSCTATNIAGTSNKATKQINVHYGPMISNISNQQDISEGNNLIVSPIVDANPVPKLVWWTKQNDANFRYDGFVLRINNINRKSSGNYSCYVRNTLAPSGMSKINRTTQQTFSVNVIFKPFLDSSKPYSPGLVTAAINSTIRLTLTVNANPVPTIEWTFRANENWNSCSFITIVSNTTSNESFTSSSVLINNVNSNNFGDYVFTARNTAGVFSRRFVAMEEALLRQEMFASTKENTGMFLAGIVTLVVGLLSLMASVLFIVRNSLKNKTRNSSKTKDYSDVQRSNPAFTDPYTMLQSEIETRASQDKSVNTYEECGRYPEAHAYSSVDNIESEQSQHQQHSGNTYEECGKRIEAHAYDN